MDSWKIFSISAIAAIAVAALQVNSDFSSSGSAAEAAVADCIAYNLSCPATPTCPAPDCPDCVCPPHPELPLFMREALVVADARYYDADRRKYVCQDFAEELFTRLKADGYRPEYCIGLLKSCLEEHGENKCWHAWVKLSDNIIIEATNGVIVDPKDYGKEYDERRCMRHLPE